MNGAAGSDPAGALDERNRHMAHALTYRGRGSAGWLERARGAVADYALYRRTVRELSDLSARGLGDLGLTRSGIRQFARESVYSA